MSAPTPNRISVTTNPTFWEAFVASLILLRYRRWLIFIYAIFPLAGLFLLITPLMGYRLGVVEIFLAMLAFSYPVLVTALAVWSSRRRNKLAEGPFTYTFDAEGMHTSGDAFSQTILWTAIPRIRRSRRFLFVFIGPARAFCIPLREISDPRFLDDLWNIAGARTDFLPNTALEPTATAP
jgi:YcxB-like protein